MYGCYLIIKLTSMCDKSMCTYKTYQHDAKYVFELYSMTLQTFSYVVPASGNLLSKGWVHHPSDEQYSERYMRCRQLVKPLSHQGPGSIQTQTSLIKNRDAYEIRMQALKQLYLPLSWNGDFGFNFTNYKSRVKYRTHGLFCGNTSKVLLLFQDV